MNKLPIRYRLAALTGIALLICCIAILLSIMNTAIIKIDSIGDGALHFFTEENEEIEISINLTELSPTMAGQIDDAKNDLIKQSIFITILIVVIGAVGTIILTKVALKPLGELSEKVEKTDESNLCTLIDEPEAKDEIYVLTKAFNEMKMRLNKSFEAQKQFTSNAAHEIKTPLAVMETSLEVIQKDKNATLDDYKDTVCKTLNQLDKLSSMVNTLLDINRFKSAKKEDCVNIGELIEEIICDLEPIAEEKGIAIEFEDTQKNEPTILEKCNEIMVYRAIYNLCENAIKYNRPNGKVIISLTKADSNIEIRITDSGTGILESERDKIFETFYRVDESRSKKTGGAGLGLALVKEIAEIHNGRVFVEASTDEGTTMCLVF